MQKFDDHNPTIRFRERVEFGERLDGRGGAGNWRGGLGFVREYLILQDEVRFSLRTDKHRIEPWGNEGGQQGGKGACVINPGAKEEKRLPSRFGDYVLKRGDLLRLERPGGGGMDNPLERPLECVLEDARQGYVSMESAKLAYGVALELKNGELTLDQTGTRKLREKN